MYLTKHIVISVLKLSQPKDSYTIDSIYQMEWEIYVVKHPDSGRLRG